jgi:hypothetical protein
MAGIRRNDNAGLRGPPESTVESNVPYLFSVRNMFFCGGRVLACFDLHWPDLKSGVA